MDCFAVYQARFDDCIKPVHERFNKFFASWGEAPYPLGQFFETSPYMYLLLYPEPLHHKRRNPLDPARFQYLEG